MIVIWNWMMNEGRNNIKVKKKKEQRLILSPHNGRKRKAVCLILKIILELQYVIGLSF